MAHVSFGRYDGPGAVEAGGTLSSGDGDAPGSVVSVRQAPARDEVIVTTRARPGSTVKTEPHFREIAGSGDAGSSSHEIAE